MATPEEKEAARKAKAEELALEKEAAELKAESDRVAAELESKEEAKRKEKEMNVGTPKQDAKYNDADVKIMFKQLLKEMKEGAVADSLEDEKDPFEQKTVRIPRFIDASGKYQFVFSFKNTNKDEYFPDAVVMAYDVWNDQTKRNDPWVTLVYQDGSEMNVPLATVIKKSQVVTVPLIEVIAKDKSYSAGKTEQSVVKDYHTDGTGVKVNLKVTMADYSYKVKLPNDEIVIVGKEVINWKL